MKRPTPVKPFSRPAVDLPTHLILPHLNLLSLATMFELLVALTVAFDLLELNCCLSVDTRSWTKTLKRE